MDKDQNGREMFILAHHQVSGPPAEPNLLFKA